MQETIHDVITATWEKAKSHLTKKQRLWGETFLSLGFPTSAEVGRVLNVSKVASNKMKWRLLKKLLPFYYEFSTEKRNDEKLKQIAKIKQKRILKTPERLIKRRGQNHWEYLRAAKVEITRLGKGLEFYSGYTIEMVNPEEVTTLLNRLPLTITTTHKSPLPEWWKKKTTEYASVKNIKYIQAHTELFKSYSLKWKKKAAEHASDGLCSFCRCLLPLGEIIPGSKMGRVTTRRKYCSDSCKTLFKRHRS